MSGMSPNGAGRGAGRGARGTSSYTGGYNERARRSSSPDTTRSAAATGSAAATTQPPSYEQVHANSDTSSTSASWLGHIFNRSHGGHGGHGSMEVEGHGGRSETTEAARAAEVRLESEYVHVKLPETPQLPETNFQWDSGMPESHEIRENVVQNMKMFKRQGMSGEVAFDLACQRELANLVNGAAAENKMSPMKLISKASEIIKGGPGDRRSTSVKNYEEKYLLPVINAYIELAEAVLGTGQGNSSCVKEAIELALKGADTVKFPNTAKLANKLLLGQCALNFLSNFNLRGENPDDMERNPIAYVSSTTYTFYSTKETQTFTDLASLATNNVFVNHPTNHPSLIRHLSYKILNNPKSKGEEGFELYENQRELLEEWTEGACKDLDGYLNLFGHYCANSGTTDEDTTAYVNTNLPREKAAFNKGDITKHPLEDSSKEDFEKSDLACRNKAYQQELKHKIHAQTLGSSVIQTDRTLFWSPDIKSGSDDRSFGLGMAFNVTPSKASGHAAAASASWMDVEAVGNDAVYSLLIRQSLQTVVANDAVGFSGRQQATPLVLQGGSSAKAVENRYIGHQEIMCLIENAQQARSAYSYTSTRQGDYKPPPASSASSGC